MASTSATSIALPPIPRNNLASSAPRKHPPLTSAIFRFPARGFTFFLPKSTRFSVGGVLRQRQLGKSSGGCETSEKIENVGTRAGIKSGFSSFGSRDEKYARKVTNLRRREQKDGFGSPGVTSEEVARRQSLKELVSKMVKRRSERSGENEGGKSGKDVGLEKKREMGRGNCSAQRKGESFKLGSRHENHGGKASDNRSEEVIRVSKRSRKSKTKTPEMQLRGVLDTCSKMGDFIGAIRAYDSARKDGIKLGQYHYTVVLYLCASAASGVVNPAKSGTGTRTLNSLAFSDNDLAVNSVNISDSRVGHSGNSKSNLYVSTDAKEITDAEIVYGNNSRDDFGSHSTFGGNENTVNAMPSKLHSNDDLSDNGNIKDDLVGSFNGVVREKQMVLLDENVKRYALKRGLEIYEDMCSDQIPRNEAALTSVARMAMTIGDGDMAFSMVKEMILLGINPRLRSYGPALSAFCNCRDIDKAFEVEKHMLDHGIHPEEPELQALLRVSVAAGKGEKVYYLLHKLRTNARKVTPDTAALIERWFSGQIASKLGKQMWGIHKTKALMESVGGGWHGKGWLGKGKWFLSRTSIDPCGLCRCCGEKLAIIDLDPVETVNFAQSVAAIAIKREKNSFEKFQKWLDYHGPFEAIIDGANVGLFSQIRFSPSKINIVANGIRQRLCLKRWPLIVLHNKRVVGGKMDDPVNKATVDKWRNADALYATPTGSNDDWYWLYAAIKFKSLIITNDEMRDHLFQILGNDFFPKWKERHQVRFSFSDTGPVFHMPPPYSVVIQESERGHWHIPISAEQEYEADRTWLCVTRATCTDTFNSEDEQSNHGLSAQQCQICEGPDTAEPLVQAKRDNVEEANPKVFGNLKNIVFASVLQRHCYLISELENAEALGNCVIDFQI